MASTNCMSCNSGANDNILICSGVCRNVAHFKCVGLKKSAFELICNSTNIFWFCDKCKDLSNLQNNNICEIMKIINQIDSSVKKIECNNNVNNNNCACATTSPGVVCDNSVSSIPLSPMTFSGNDNSSDSSRLVTTKIVPSTSPVVVFAPPVGVDNISKITNRTSIVEINLPSVNQNKFKLNSSPIIDCESRAFSEVVRLPNVTASATEPPVSSESTSSGNLKYNPNLIIIGSGSESTLRSVEHRKNVFVSRLHPDITTADVNKYMIEKFNLSNSRIHRFKTKVNDINPDYSSFKISVLNSDFKILMDSTLWPKGTLIKEFQQKSRNRPFLGGH